MADINADYWTMADIADYLGVRLSSVHMYRHRGELPEEDRTVGRTPVWTPSRIVRWNEQERPGRGRRPTRSVPRA